MGVATSSAHDDENGRSTIECWQIGRSSWDREQLTPQSVDASHSPTEHPQTTEAATLEAGPETMKCDRAVAQLGRKRHETTFSRFSMVASLQPPQKNPKLVFKCSINTCSHAAEPNLYMTPEHSHAARKACIFRCRRSRTHTSQKESTCH